MRQQAKIWSDVSSSEVEKMRAEGELLTGQLAQRSAELAALRQQLTDVEAERDRALQVGWPKLLLPADAERDALWNVQYLACVMHCSSR
jgi:hypothetical protein